MKRCRAEHGNGSCDRGAQASVALWSALLAVAAAFGAVMSGAVAAAEEPTKSPPASGSVEVTIQTGEYQVSATPQGHKITAEDLGTLLIPGKPLLPSKIFAIAVPPGAEVTGVSFDPGEGTLLPGVYDVAPAPLPRVIGEENPDLYAADQQRYQRNHESVYGSDEPYPGSVGERVRNAGYRAYDLVDVRITPFSYRPQSGRLVHYPEVTVRVDYRLPDERRQVRVDRLVRTERIAEEIIVNYAEAAAWQPATRAADGGLHDYVIITLDSLTSAVAPLANWETQKGRTVEVVTTSWINANYSGYDLAEKMRNFLRDKYPSSQWGILDVLMVGHYDDVPMRRTWQDMGYGKPETDYYYAELSLPDAESWDADGDHRWGEDSDPIDFYTEVNVGRIPWSDPATVLSICEKSIAYEQSDDPTFKKNMLLLGAFYWADTDNAVLMEAKVDQPWMSDWTMTRMYEQNSGAWSAYDCDMPLLHENAMDVWSAGKFAFVNWAGHGSPTSTHIMGLGAPAFISASDCPYLNDDYPAIIFAAACSNSDTDHLNIGQAMLQQGSIGFVGATKVAFGYPGWDDPEDGSTPSLDYLFTSCVTSGDYTQGQALQWALREMYVNGSWYYNEYETFEWGALWGNPNLGMAPAISLRIQFPNGVPSLLSSSEETPVDVEILPIGQAVVPDSPTLYYRLGDEALQTVPLEALGGALYRAVLPAADCGVMARFYFSAEGSTAGMVYAPADAPQNSFVAGVGELVTVLEDDFEIGQGWTVENVDLTAGSWERGAPIGDGSRGDPLADFDGSGQCYLTGNAAGNSDVDGGPTMLISPLLDLSSANDPMLEYARWFSCDDDVPPSQDFMEVTITSDDGASWILIESVPDSSGWAERTKRIADYVPLTDQIRVRFSVADNPNNSIVEGGIDAVRVYDLACAEAGDGDFDGDGDVDLDDFAVFSDCLAGPNSPSSPTPPLSAQDCLGAFDFEPDNDVDLGDFSEFLAAFVGS